MDLIYGQFKNDAIEDINVLQDYSFDEQYGLGDDTNDFVCKVQKYNHKCVADNVLYVEFTEYGGIIDTIDVDSKSGVVSYKGRTWHGVLNSHVIEPLTSRAARQYSGEINDILGDMIEDLGVGNIFIADAVPLNDRDVEVAAFSVRYEKGYSAMIRLMQETECKLIMYFFNGMVHIGALRAVDFSHDEEFDNGQTPYRAGITDNNVNHLICLGKGENEQRAVIHLFTDERGIIQPYTLISNPLEDCEYILDKRNQVITGYEEITEIYDASNSEIITNYKKHYSKPSDWASQYDKKYYEDGEIDESTGQAKKTKIKEITRTEYRRRYDKPSGWETNYSDYYYNDTSKPTKPYYMKKDGVYVKLKEAEQGETMDDIYRFPHSYDIMGDFTTVKSVSEGQGAVVHWDAQPNVQPPDWETNYSDYYTLKGTNDHEQVGTRNVDHYGATDTYDGVNITVHNGVKLSQAPPDWNWNFANYVYMTTNAVGTKIFTAIEGIHNYKADKVTAKKTPNGWANNWSTYYVKAAAKKIKKGTNIIKIGGGNYITASDAINSGILKKISNDKPYPKYAPNTFYILTQLADTAPKFAKYNKNQYKGVYEKFSVPYPPIWDSTRTYFKKRIEDAPVFENGIYYEKYDDVRQVPDFSLKNYYYAVEDRLRKLAESGVEKLKQLRDTSTLEIDLELDSNYDILDIIGVTDEITGIKVAKPIKRKIIEIKKDLLSVRYEME